MVINSFRVFETIDRDVYTLAGKYVGRVTDLIVDVEARSIVALTVKIRTGKGLYRSEVLSVPYELVASIGDIVLIGGRK